MKNRRRLWIVLATVCTFLICAGLCVGLILHRESELNDIQNEALEELRDHRGEYDEKSIVLYDTNRGEAQALAEKFEAELRISFDGKFATLTLPGDVTVEDIYSARGNRKYIADMALDYQVRTSELTESEDEGNGERLPTRPQYSVSDEDYALQGYLDYLNMKDVWNWTTGYDITIAVIDTGIDTDHPEFAGRISEYSYNATEDKIVKDYLLEDGSYDWSLVEDEQGHGTAVTGVIAASMNEGKVVGIAPSVTIITIKAECDENGRFARTSDLVFGLYYAIERDVDVVNMSFGVQSLINPFAEATQLALDSDVICVAAAGNEGTASLSYPAADSNVFGVGALEADGWNLASYSNYGENVNLVAPGTTYTTLMGGKYGTMNGTSLASPVVTGAIALYLSANRYQEFLTVEEVLYASCYDLGDLGCDYYYGYGALDISALIMEERGTVTFNMMTDELENTEQLFIRDHTLQNMPEPERLYAIFDGWYYDPYGTEEYNWYTDKFSTDLTLYAKWVNEEDGIPFTYVELEDGTIEIRSYTGHRRYITIPDMIDGKIVSSIGEEAFKGETRLREVILPKELKRIRRSAFEGCDNLVHIDLPDTVIEIGEKAFYNNVRLSYVGVGGGSQLASIGNFAFSNCAKLQRFELPASVVSVNGSAFYGATNLTAFTVRAGNKSFTAKDGVLFNYTQSTLVAYPTGLRTEYTIPATVLTIGDYAFGYMRFAGINLGSVQTIGNFAFANSELESIVIPDTVTQMGEAAFEANFYLRSVQLGNGLTAISKYAFSNCTALEQIEIPANIREIQQGAFANTLGMTSVTFAPDSKLTAIGASAFASSSLSSVAIPASVISIGDAAFAQHPWAPLVSVTFAEDSQLRTIGEEAFKGTYRLTSIDLPEQLTSLGAFAFMESGLEQVTIPASLTFFGAGAFAACHSLTAITVEEANTAYIDVDGVVYDKAKTTLIEYPAGNTRSDYTVLNTVTALEEDAFYGSWNLYTVYLPESLQEIRRETFFDCQGLNYIQIPDNVMQISNHAFAQCWNLRNVYLNDTSKLPRISYEAFAYCGLQSFRVPANVSTMAQGAFEGCYRMNSFTFAANSKLEAISAYMFDGCDNLQSITFEEGSALNSIQAHGLEGMRKLTSINFGDAKITNIDNFAFRFCESLTRVDLPEGVTEIGRYAFYYCTSLNEVSIPTSVEFIGRFAFLGTQNLNVYFASETLPAYLQEDWDYGTAGYYLGVTDVITDGDWKYAKLTSGDIAIIQYNGTETSIDLTKLNLGGDIVNIGGEAFAYSTVESIVLPETLVTIQNEAFYHSTLKAISIPASVDFIGRSAFADTPIETLTFASNAKLRVMEQSAFEGTKSLGSVTLPKSLTTIGRAIFKNSGITSLTFEDGIGITEISEEAFAYTNITTVTIPDSVTLLNHSAFRETKQLKSVNFGNSEGIMIMSNVFYHSGLESVHIPTNVTYVGEYAFVALTNLQSFTVDADHPQYRAIDGLLVTKDGRKLIAAPAGREGTLTVPAGIEVIGFGAFEESKLTKINFLADANILSFGYRAFYGSAITEMHVPASVVAIDYYAFATCESLTKVTFAEDNQLRGIYEGAFYNCPNLYDITLPDAIVEISDFAFYGCKKIDKLPISNTSTIKGIYDYAFAYAGLEGAFTTPETLIDIGAHAFMGNKFTSVTVPDTNAYDLVIGIGVFEGCNNLEEITLPFIGASFEDPDYTWFGYIFGAGGYEANSTYVPESLKKVTITEGISFVGTGAFFAQETVYSDGGTAISWTYGMQIEQLNLPESIKEVYAYAFTDFGARFSLCDIQVIELFESWEDSAFERSGLQSITFGDSLTKIQARLFYECYNLKKIFIPATLTDVGREPINSELAASAFYETSVMVEVHPDNPIYKSINGNLYLKEDGFLLHQCQELTGDYIETEDGFVFTKDYKLIGYVGNEDTVVFPQNINGNTYSIYHMRGVKHVIIPEGITEIGQEAFSGCETLETIVLPESINHIGDNAFNTCINLSSITFPHNMQSIGVAVFSNCYNLREITLPEGIYSIHNYLFSSCRSLIKIDIPESVTRIGALVFSGCTNLKNMYIPKSVSQIESAAFANCQFNTFVIDPENDYIVEMDGVIYNKDITQIMCVLDGVKEVIVPETVKIADFLHAHTIQRVVFSANSQTTQINFVNCEQLVSVVLPNNMIKIPSGAFSGCYMLSDIIFPENLTEIEDYAFQACYSLSNVVIPEGVTTIGRYVFGFLRSVTLPSTLTYIGYNAFGGDVTTIINNSDFVLEFGSEENGRVAYNAKLIIDKNGNKRYRDDEPDKEYISTPDGFLFVKEDQQYKLIQYFGNQDTVTLPQNINGENYTLWQFNGAKNVIIPEGFTEIGERAFENSFTLVSIQVPNTVKYIRYLAFGNCYSLESIVIPGSVLSIDGAFGMCPSLTKVEIQEGVKFIAEGAFSDCKNLSEIIIPNSVVQIGGGAFLETAYYSNPDNWENGALYIGNYLIKVDSDVEYFEVRSDTRAIARDAFENCYRLKHLTIGGEQEFMLLSSLTNLETLVITELPDEISDYFGSVSNIPITLKNIVLVDGVYMKLKAFYQQWDIESIPITGVTIYVEANEKDVRWDENFPGWSAGNKVVYGDEWIYADFYDNNGISAKIAVSTSRVIRVPFAEDYIDGVWRCVFQGYDINGDGIADVIPATSTTDIVAYAVYHKEYRCVQEGHFISKATCIHRAMCLYCNEEFGEPIGHNWGNWNEIKAPICTATGTDERECSVCHTKETRITDALGHTNAAVIVENRVEPNCTIDGNYDSVIYCSICGEELSREAKVIEKLGHDYSTGWTVDVAPTCTTVGSKSHHCSRCSDKADITEIPSNGHSWGNWYETKTPTCTTTGTDERECSVCHAKETRITDALGHTNAAVIVENRVEPNCTTDGNYDSVIYCSICGEELSREAKVIEKLGHDYSTEWTVDVAPTCTTVGSKSHHCSRCSDKADITEIPSNGHSWGNWYETKTPTCTTTGTDERECSVCYTKETRITDVLGHTNATPTIENYIEPNCTTDGSYDSVVYCSVCSIELSREQKIIDMIGHEYDSEWTVEIEPTCTTEGSKSHHCIRCDDKADIIEIPANGHSFSNWNTLVFPDCETNGWATRYCHYCNMTEEMSIAPLGHNFSEWSVWVFPSCEENGTTARYCYRCYTNEYETIDPLGHTNAIPVAENKVEATCIVDGSYDSVTYCSACNTEVSREIKIIAKLGHSEILHSGKSATCTESGWKEYVTCSRCDYTTYEVIAALGHNKIHHNGKVPTCTEFGWKEYVTCSRCDYSTYEELPATGHKASEWIIDEEATYGKDGSKHKECTVCGDILEESIVPMLTHKYVPVVTAPTCTEQGYTTHTCSDCGNSYVDDYTAALGHSYVYEEWKEVVSPSCVQNGREERCCEICSFCESREIMSFGHTNAAPVVENKADATCTTDGSYDSVVYCSVCQAEVSRESKVITKLGHNYSIEWTVDVKATCTTHGSMSHHCTRCDDKANITEIPANGHSWSDWYETKAPTCTTTGTDERECSVCYTKETRATGAKGHTAATAVIENKVDATCTVDGSYDSVVYCSVCQAEIGRETKAIEKLGHLEIVHSGKVATCTELGWKEYLTCSRCDYSTYELIEALGHDEIHYTGKTPTCTEHGWSVYVTCSRCDYSTYEELPATGHSASRWIIDEEATYDKDGRKHKECTVCGTVLEESIIPMLSHKYVSVVTAPTCTEQGYTTHTCGDCGNSYVDDYIPATGHNYDIEWTVDIEPTCTTVGSQSYHCTRCDVKKDVTEIPASGHAFGDWQQVKAPTCTDIGAERRYCANCDTFEKRPVDALGHSFTNYVSNNDATYTADGTKTAKCDRCNEKNTIVDEGSALGMAQKFRDEMVELNQNADTETTYGELYAILQTYASLSAKEKEDVAKEFATLQQMINAYNTKAQTANNELAEATEIAFGPIAATSFAFLAALWFLLRKKFLV